MTDLHVFLLMGLFIDTWDKLETGMLHLYGSIIRDHLNVTEFVRLQKISCRCAKLKEIVNENLYNSDRKDCINLINKISKYNTYRNGIVHGKWIQVFVDSHVCFLLSDNYELANKILFIYLSKKNYDQK